MSDDTEGTIIYLRKRSVNAGPKELTSISGGKKSDKYWIDQWIQMQEKIKIEKSHLYQKNMSAHYLLAGLWEYEVMIRTTRIHLKEFRAPLVHDDMTIILVPEAHMLTVVPSPIEYWRNLISVD